MKKVNGVEFPSHVLGRENFNARIAYDCIFCNTAHSTMAECEKCMEKCVKDDASYPYIASCIRAMRGGSMNNLRTVYECAFCKTTYEDMNDANKCKDTCVFENPTPIHINKYNMGMVSEFINKNSNYMSLHFKAGEDNQMLFIRESRYNGEEKTARLGECIYFVEDVMYILPKLPSNMNLTFSVGGRKEEDHAYFC